MDIKDYDSYMEHIEHVTLQKPYNTYLCSIPLDFYNVPLHWHNEVEIIYIKKGQGLVTIDLIHYHVKRGSILFVFPGQLHSIEQDVNYAMEYENILFDPAFLLSALPDEDTANFLAPLFMRQLSVSAYWEPGMQHYSALSSFIDQADFISARKAKASLLGIKAQFYQLFFYLISENCITKVIEPIEPVDKVKKILHFLEEHYSEKITIQDIASYCGYSSSRFMHFFKDQMKTSFICYLREYRLNKAAKYLLHSEADIDTIAYDCGFDNLSYFNRSFKAQFNMTPSQFRKARV